MATPEFITAYLDTIDAITTRLNTNNLIAQTRTAVLNGIKSFQVTPAEKAKLYANFEIQFSVDVVTKVVDTAMQASVSEVQIQELNARVALLTQQLQSELKNTEKLQKEIDLLGSNKLLVDAQKITEEKRKLDVMAGINIKNWQAEGAKQGALFEESRRFVLLKSTKFNSQIQKADKSTAWFNSLAVDDGFTMTESHITSVKTDIDGITVEDITYTSGITTAVAHVDYGS